MHQAISLQTHSAQEVILREGDPGECAHVIRSGAVEITTLRDGKRVRLAKLGPGDLFGEMALIDRQVRSATVTALEATETVVIDQSRVFHDLSSSKPLIQFLLRVMVARLRQADHQVFEDRRKETGRFLLSALGLDSAEVPGALQQARDEVLENLTREQDLQRALDQDELELFYQPIVRLEDRRIAGFEALLRWRHPERGLVPPAEFIPLAESSGLIGPIGLRIMEDACAMLAEVNYLARGLEDRLFVSVNVSAAQLSEPLLIERLPTILSDTGIDPGTLHIEITENLLMEDPEHAVGVLDSLKSMGIRLSIDDFGTGYSSLSYLKKFPLDTLKIDRSFISTMLEEPVSEQIVRAVANLATDLRLDIVAEGVEEEGQLHALQALGCGHGQGYLFAPALARDELFVVLHRGGRFASDLGAIDSDLAPAPGELASQTWSSRGALDDGADEVAGEIRQQAAPDQRWAGAMSSALGCGNGGERPLLAGNLRPRPYERALLASKINDVMSTQVLRRGIDFALACKETLEDATSAESFAAGGDLGDIGELELMR